jgi:membrane-anchored glycerophosphoryl diester phosphodiesterase (GDPDase)
VVYGESAMNSQRKQFELFMKRVGLLIGGFILLMALGLAWTLYSYDMPQLVRLILALSEFVFTLVGGFFIAVFSE